MKIAYIVNGLYNSAGMERVLTVRANNLCNLYDITFITKAQGNRPDYFPLDKTIHRIDIAEEVAYREGLEKCLLENKYDITVSTGGSEFYFLYKIKDGSKKIFEFHFSYDISQVWMSGVKNSFKRKILIELQKFRRIYIARYYDKVVVLTKTDCQRWGRWLSNVTYIYNPLTIVPKNKSLVMDKTVIAVGRLDRQKGFDLLINAWEIVFASFPDWKLHIYGEGILREQLQSLIDRKGLSSSLVLCGATNNIISKYCESSIFILSSRTEAFGLVLTEAEACGLPIVAFDCPSGPRELMEDGENGFLVRPVGNIEQLANRIIKLISDVSLRQKMGQRSSELSQKFSIENISKKWVQLYNQL
ncbi:glycosyltransferase family 4 protein [Prevotella veroralis]|uniref:Glycosyltransferase, group 1 family protein n=1 Tax=Prevotella veroralis F0319 TaxID=649761 RepID=C9MQ00_9BACT|nr:glycosyltransferase family 4 protein [Prevotella veroralis]EEX18503.1 glycosyltransferase, group 1 family protein [Prevotella veroralis F0319]QUB40063.1 glycosyltransferase family 4 protein [Prevotella veroralis]